MIVAIRHGPVAADGICYGRWNPPLVNPPEVDANTILRALADLPVASDSAPNAAGGNIARIVSSSADRCRQIAVSLAARLGLEVHEDQRIAELSMGDWEGKPWNWIEEHDGERLRLWMEQWQTAAPPGGESLADLEARVRAAGDAAAGPGRTMWVTHAGVIRTLRVLLRGSDWPMAMQGRVPHLAPELFLAGG
jgi:alpha-ribazole phosphatase